MRKQITVKKLLETEAWTNLCYWTRKEDSETDKERKAAYHKKAMTCAHGLSRRYDVI